MPLVRSFFKSRARRAAVIAGIVLIVLITLLFVVISPLAKYLLQKYDDKILGRTIEVSWMYVNPFTGCVHLKGVRVMEQNSDTVFFRADAITANLSLLKLLHRTIEISSLTVYKPWGHIVQNKRLINFKDIIEHFKPREGTVKVNKKRFRFSMLDCKLEDGTFQFDEVTIPVTYFIKHMNVTSPGKWWDRDTMIFYVKLESGPTPGRINGNLTINFKNQHYRFGGAIDSFDLKPLTQYMRQLSNYGDFGGILNAKVDGMGHFKSKFVRTSGLISINVFQFGPSIYEDYGSFQRLVLDIIDADPENRKYRIDSIMLDRPYFRYEKYDSLDNLALMFGKKGSKPGVGGGVQYNLILKIAEYLQEVVKNFAKSDYQVHKFTLHKGNFVFNDFSPGERFSVDAMPINLRSDSIDKNKPRIKIASTIGVRPYGDLFLRANLDPKNIGTFDIIYGIDNVPLASFNPYVLKYTSFPLKRGTLRLNGTWNVVDSVIHSQNHLLIMNPRVGKRMKRDDNKWIPVPLILSVAREPGDVIDYWIPVRGDLKKPKFVLKEVIKDIVKNIFVKPPMTPYFMHIMRQEKIVQNMLNIDWDARQTGLSYQEERFIGIMARHLKSNPSNTITVHPQVFEAREKEFIAFFEGKKKYFLSQQARGYKMTEDDSLYIDHLSIKDSDFVRYINRFKGDSMIFTTEQKCRLIVGDALIEARLNQLNAARKKVFLQRFFETSTEGQVKFAKHELGVPFNGFSRYTIDYNGEVPDKLRKAYEAIDDMNHRAPRKKYKVRWLPKVKGLKRKE